MFQPTKWISDYPDFVFVNFNYRLNSFGFFAVETKNEDGVNGNFGAYDQNQVRNIKVVILKKFE